MENELKIKELRKYKVPEYPQIAYQQHIQNFLAKNFVKSGSLLFILAMIQGCDDGIGTGGMPLPPDLVSEEDACDLILQTFEQNDILFNRNFPLEITIDDYDSTTVDTNTITVHLDGYNADLKLGYEYIGDYEDYNEEVMEFYDNWYLSDHFRQAGIDREYIVKIIEGYIDEEGWEAILQNDIQGFIDSLRTVGMI